MKLFFNKIFLFFPLLLIVVSINYYIDPAKVFQMGHYEFNLANHLLKGENVANVSNYDDRLLQKYYILDYHSFIDTIVLGSSRSMEIRSEKNSNNTFHNHSVAGATIEDYIAIFGMYYEKRLLPHTIILGTDPWIFNKNNDQTRWRSLKSEYLRFVKILDNKNFDFIHFYSSSVTDKLFQLVSPAYFNTSLKKIFFDRSNMVDSLYITTHENPDEGMLRSDGFYVYPIEKRAAGTMEIRKRANEFINLKPVYALGNYFNIDPRLKELWNIFICCLKNNKIEIILFLPPYHPIVYKYLSESEQYKIINTVEQFFLTYAQDNSLKIIGSFNPSKVNLSEDAFYDGMHVKPDAISKIFSISN